MTNNVAGVVSELQQKQRELAMTDIDFAQKLAVSRQLWAAIKKGHRQPGLKFLRAVIREFPDLQLDVFNLMAGSKEGKEVK